MQLSEFREKISSGNFLVDFYTKWCKPCKIVSPIVDQASKLINIIKIDVEADVDIGNEYAISAVPTVIVFKDGKAVERVTGIFAFSRLEEIIKKL